MLVDRSARVWAMRRDEVMASHALQLRAATAAGEVQAFGSGVSLEGSDFARVMEGGIAVIPVKGPLMRSFSFWAWSYEEVERDLKLAQASPMVRSIILDIDSPGGLASGCGDLAAVIRAGGPKPIEAFVGGMAASAAYWIASAASRVRVGSGAILGSIGSVIEYVDMEPMFEKMGAKMVRVVAEQSPNKRLDPHGPEGQAELQALVDAVGREFVDGVAANRSVSAAVVLDRFGQGLVFDGMEAIARGMADARTTLDEMIAEMAGRSFTIVAAPAAAAQENPMDWANLTMAALREHRADLVAEVERSAAATATAIATVSGAVAERERILSLESIAVEGFEALTAAAKADGKTTAAELALQIVKADRTAGSNVLAARAAADPLAAVTPAQLVSSTVATGSVEDQATAQWTKDATLRAEFGGNFDNYLAFEKANASGQARILRAAR